MKFYRGGYLLCKVLLIAIESIVIGQVLDLQQCLASLEGSSDGEGHVLDKAIAEQLLGGSLRVNLVLGGQLFLEGGGGQGGVVVGLQG